MLTAAEKVEHFTHVADKLYPKLCKNANPDISCLGSLMAHHSRADWCEIYVFIVSCQDGRRYPPNDTLKCELQRVDCTRRGWSFLPGKQDRPVPKVYARET